MVLGVTRRLAAELAKVPDVVERNRGLPEPSTSVTTKGLSATVEVRPNWLLPEVIDSTGLPATGVTTVLLEAGAVSLESAEPVLVTLPAPTSAAVTTCVPVSVQLPPTATLAQVLLAGVS